MEGNEPMGWLLLLKNVQLQGVHGGLIEEDA